MLKPSVNPSTSSDALPGSVNTGEPVKHRPSGSVWRAPNFRSAVSSAVAAPDVPRGDDVAQKTVSVWGAPNYPRTTIPAGATPDEFRESDGAHPLTAAETVVVIAPENPTLDGLAKVVTPKDGNQKKSRSTEAAEKKKDPQSFPEYIELFYAGKNKSLAEKSLVEALAQRLTGHSAAMAPEMRSALLQKAIGLDASLEKTRNLMQLARSARPNRTLESMFREFAQDVVALHPALRNHGLSRSYLFPLSEQGQSLQDVWSALSKCNSKEKTSKIKVIKTEPALADKAVEPISKDDAVIVSVPLENTSKSDSDGDSTDAVVSTETKNNPEKDFVKARRNAFLCAVVWRREQESASFGDTHRVFKDTVLRLKSKPDNMEDDLLESLLSLSATEAEKVGLYAEWANQSINAQINRAGLLEEQVANNVKKVERLSSQNEEQAVLLTQRNEELDILKRQLQELQSELAVQKVHARADYEELRARSLGVLKKEVMDLENVEIALSRPIPKVETAKDVVTVVVDSLQAYINDLEGKR